MIKNKLMILRYTVLILIIVPLIACAPITSGPKTKETIKRIGPENTRNLIKTGQALLVCSYDDAACAKIMLDGALLKSELESQVSGLSKDREIIFY